MFLGLDLGTSGLKAVLIDADQTVLATTGASLSVMRPRKGWSEQEPRAWIAAAERALDALSAKMELSGVRGIGLSGQMHGATLLDAAASPCDPASCGTILAPSPRRRHLTMTPPGGRSVEISSSPALPPQNLLGYGRTNQRCSIV